MQGNAGIATALDNTFDKESNEDILDHNTTQVLLENLAAGEEFKGTGKDLNQQKLTKKEKKAKSKKIKKILKDRLNIDCLRMLCDMSGDEDNDGLEQTRKRPQMLNQSMNDSYQVLMREIMVDNEATMPDQTNTSSIQEEVEVLNDF